MLPSWANGKQYRFWFQFHWKEIKNKQIMHILRAVLLFSVFTKEGKCEFYCIQLREENRNSCKKYWIHYFDTSSASQLSTWKWKFIQWFFTKRKTQTADAIASFLSSLVVTKPFSFLWYFFTCSLWISHIPRIPLWWVSRRRMEFQFLDDDININKYSFVETKSSFRSRRHKSILFTCLRLIRVVTITDDSLCHLHILLTEKCSQ